jgi:hypothetical protein
MLFVYLNSQSDKQEYKSEHQTNFIRISVED